MCSSHHGGITHMTYTETLALAKAHNIDIAQLAIAYEVACCYEQGIETPRFEDICRAVYNLWLKTDHIEVNTLVLALQDAIDNEGCTLDDVLSYGESWHMVIELACQCTY